MAEIWDWVFEERRALVDQLEQLSAQQWSTPSALAGWQVHHVVAHLVWTLQTSFPRMLLQLAWRRFDIDRTLDEAVVAERRAPAELVRALRQHLGRRGCPPGVGPETPLTEILVHGLDIRQPLRLAHPIPAERARIGLALLVSPAAAKGFAPAHLPDGLRWEATDLDWAHGDGPKVRGTAADLLLTLCGRSAALDQLQGDGVATVRQRLAR